MFVTEDLAAHSGSRAMLGLFQQNQTGPTSLEELWGPPAENVIENVFYAAKQFVRSENILQNSEMPIDKL